MTEAVVRDHVIDDGLDDVILSSRSDDTFLDKQTRPENWLSLLVAQTEKASLAIPLKTWMGNSVQMFNEVSLSHFAIVFSPRNNNWNRTLR